MIDNKEDVARVIFSPKMIHNGILTRTSPVNNVN